MRVIMIDSPQWPELERKAENRNLKANLRFIEEYVQRLLSRRERRLEGAVESEFVAK